LDAFAIKVLFKSNFHLVKQENGVAHHKSAKKRIRQTAKRTAANKSKKSEMRTAVKGLRGAIANKNKEEASKLLPHVQSLFRKLTKSGILKLGHTSEKTSRLAKQVARL